MDASLWFRCFRRAVGELEGIENCSRRRSAVKGGHNDVRCDVYVVTHGDDDAHTAFSPTRVHQLPETPREKSVEEVLEEGQVLPIPLQRIGQQETHQPSLPCCGDALASEANRQGSQRFAPLAGRECYENQLHTRK